MPLAGGTVIPTVAAATLPNDLFVAQRTTGAAQQRPLPRRRRRTRLQSSDGGPDWTTSDGFVNGGNVADWGTTVPRDATVPASTPADIFSSERYGQQDWNFPVTPGDHVTIRLYFANQYDGTSQPGQRVFNVADRRQHRAVELRHRRRRGQQDPHHAVLHHHHTTARGRHRPPGGHENPLINGIEIIDNDAPTGGSTTGVLQRRAVDATGAPTGAPSTANSAMDWSTVRGAFLLNGTLYYGLNDGNLYKRTFNKTTGAIGTQKVVNLYDDPDDGGRIPFSIANMTGMFYDTATHRIYYTLFGDARLFYRYFTPQSDVVGAQTFTADTAGVNFGSVAGMTLASGQILYGSSADGSLRSVPFSGGQVAGSPTVVSSDGTWRYRAILVPNS